jgi:hypothetical protein
MFTHLILVLLLDELLQGLVCCEKLSLDLFSVFVLEYTAGHRWGPPHPLISECEDGKNPNVRNSVS